MVDAYVWCMAYIQYEQERDPSDVVRWLADRDGWRLAGASRFVEPAAESLHPRELRGVPIRRATSELGAVWPSEGRRFSVYVPEELVPQVRRCLDNGRAVQELLHEAAPRYIKALKRERAKAAKQ